MRSCGGHVPYDASSPQRVLSVEKEVNAEDGDAREGVGAAYDDTNCGLVFKFEVSVFHTLGAADEDWNADKPAGGSVIGVDNVEPRRRPASEVRAVPASEHGDLGSCDRRELR